MRIKGGTVKGREKKINGHVVCGPESLRDGHVMFRRREKKKSKTQTIQCTVYRVTPVWYPYMSRHQYMNLKQKHSKRGCGSSEWTMQTKER